MKKSIILAFAALALSGCGSAPPIESATNEQGVTSYLIAIVDGCNVWAIDRGGISEVIYMARCPEGAATMKHDYNKGMTQTTVGAQ